MKVETLDYTCEYCDTAVRVDRKAAPPECCGKIMTPRVEPMPHCTTAANPEMTRNIDDDEPCD